MGLFCYSWESAQSSPDEGNGNPTYATMTISVSDLANKPLTRWVKAGSIFILIRMVGVGLRFADGGRGSSQSLYYLVIVPVLGLGWVRFADGRGWAEWGLRMVGVGLSEVCGWSELGWGLRMVGVVLSCHISCFVAVIGLLYPHVDEKLGCPHKFRTEWPSVMRCIAVFVGINHASAVSFILHFPKTIPR